jgi:UDP-2,3-diacylglucosamine pyrophosphatase LpxH
MITFKGQTANGTFIEKVDMEKAFNEALQFYVTLLSEAIKHSESVECRYVKGNHDESISYGFFRTLQATFPQVEFIGNLKQRIAFTWEKVFIGLTHGDKGANRIVENFISEYGKLIANAEVKEIHSGHIHTEKSNDNFGITQRSLSTANKTDDWHDDNGFIGANKRFQLFEYSPNSLDAIYYI